MTGYHKQQNQRGDLALKISFNSGELNTIYKRINETRWDFASKNEDDDFHTDVVFLKVTCKEIEEEIGDHHTKTLLMYQNYCGEFYFTKENTKRLCTNIINKLKDEPVWRENFNYNIYRTADNLFNVFNGIALIDFKKMSTEALYLLYKTQHEAQIELYKKCWIAEVIQVPEVGITDYLVEYIKKFGTSAETAEKIFYDLTRSAKDSVYVEEERKVIGLAEKILADETLVSKFQYPLKYLRTYIPCDIELEIESIRERYGYLAYHGFSNRQPHTLDDYLGRIQEYVLTPTKLIEEKNKWERDLVVDSKEINALLLKMDAIHRELFEVYAELAVSKAYRRLAQLKNFYYIDALIHTIALRFNLPESYLRFMLPEEIMLLLQGHQDQLDLNHIAKRTENMVYLVDQDTEMIFIEEEANIIRNKFKLLEEEPVVETVLRGRSACMGVCLGKAVVVERNQDVQDFSYGDILVSLEADPDLIPIMKKAGAIVTDQGGITCHAAVIAREFNIPCVTGTISATKVIKTGDIVFVDANKGEVTIEKQ